MEFRHSLPRFRSLGARGNGCGRLRPVERFEHHIGHNSLALGGIDGARRVFVHRIAADRPRRREDRGLALCGPIIQQSKLALQHLRRGDDLDIAALQRAIIVDQRIARRTQLHAG